MSSEDINHMGARMPTVITLNEVGAAVSPPASKNSPVRPWLSAAERGRYPYTINPERETVIMFERGLSNFTIVAFYPGYKG
jgi:hypothetical protein